METKTVMRGFSIVVADRGWVYVGTVEHDSEWCVVSDAKNIRIWGTSSGLGELADSGPTSETKMDTYGTVRIPAHAVICMIDTEAGKWKL